MLVSPSHTTHPHVLSPLSRANASATNIDTRYVASSSPSSKPAQSTSTTPSRPRLTSTTSASTVPRSATPNATPSPPPARRPARRRSPPSLHKQAALNASLRFMEVENARRAAEHARLESEAANAEFLRRQQQEAEWASENQEVSIIVTSWDDEKRCWFPIEAWGPVGRELRMFIERRRAMGGKKGEKQGEGPRKLAEMPDAI